MEITEPSKMQDAIRGGHYARKQIFSPSKIIAWSHRSRFEFACRLVEPYAGARILDYGCGDGTFLAMLGDRFGERVGADVDQTSVVEAHARLSSPHLRFCTTHDLVNDPGGYDVVTCMETLEHVCDDLMPGVLNDLARLVKPGGMVAISVPIEIGPTLLGKQVIRRVAGWRGLGDYRYNERYTWAELARMGFASSGTSIERPEYRRPTGTHSIERWHGHKGFNWRSLRERLKGYFVVEGTVFTPLGWTAGFCSSQAWMMCHKR